ncbi:hypothetical protein niasHT_005310 [Heterodera trifolii]|uniref:Uncharacterized protein n=1 Tax=Heterodera trifolii TaxID=157864 RepID=A0ABD2M0M5_9BILA
MPAADFSRFRLSKLGTLLESRNCSIRSEAVAALSQIVGSPTSDRETIVQLFALVVQYSQSSNWEGRVTAAELLNALLEETGKNFEAELVKMSAKFNREKLAQCLRAIDALSVREVLDTYRTLVSCEELSCPSSTNSACTLNSQQQRQLIDQYLEMNSATGVSSKSFISDDELSNNKCTDEQPNTFKHSTEQSKMELKRELEDNAQTAPLADDGKTTKRETEEEQGKRDEGTLLPLIHSQIVDSLAKCHLLVNLVHPKWNHRHGAALAVTKLCVHANTWLLPSPSALSGVAICLLQLLILDRFNDFVTGSSAVAPRLRKQFRHFFWLYAIGKLKKQMSNKTKTYGGRLHRQF